MLDKILIILFCCCLAIAASILVYVGISLYSLQENFKQLESDLYKLH